MTAMEAEVRESVPDPYNPGQRTPGRTIALSFAGPGKSLKPDKKWFSLPANWTGASTGWTPFTTRQSTVLEDFPGPGGVSSGGASLPNVVVEFLQRFPPSYLDERLGTRGPQIPTSYSWLQFFRAGGYPFITDAEGIDLALPGEALGYWTQHGAGMFSTASPIIRPQPLGGPDLARARHLIDEEMNRLGGRGIYARRWTSAAYQRLAGELRAERAAIMQRGVPSPADAARLAEIDRSLTQVDGMLESIEPGWLLRVLGL